jgi:response regulator RpfG family c-di-GMP phosphodiesterase
MPLSVTGKDGATAAASAHIRSRPRILCVDDDPSVLEGLADVLGRSFSVVGSSDPLEALEILKRRPDDFSVILSDMRMPSLRGSELLRMARLAAPDTVRILLTGDADVPAAVKAVNDAQLFRFLIKPCDSEELMRACAAAMGQHRLQTGQRVALQETLRGCVAVLAEVLSLVSPECSAEATRAGEVAGRLAKAAGLRDWWRVHAAAMLRQLGVVSLPPEVAQKMHAGRALTEAEEEMVASVPRVTRRLLSNVPLLDDVLQLLDGYHARRDNHNPADEVTASESLAEEVELLDVAVEYTGLELASESAEFALARLRGRGTYDRRWLELLSEILGIAAGLVVREVAVRELTVGMVLADDALTTSGGCLLPRGQLVTERVIARLENLRSDTIREPLLIIDAESDR